MFDLSLETANLLYAISNGLLILGGILVVVGSVGSFWMTNVRDRYTNERISANEKETARANEHSRVLEVDLAKTNAELEKQKELTAKAEKDLLRLRRHAAQRSIEFGQFEALIKNGPMAPVEVLYSNDDGEAFNLASQIVVSLMMAKWDTRGPSPIPPTTDPLRTRLPPAMAVGGQPVGVSVVARRETLRAFEKVSSSPVEVLVNALVRSLGQVAGGANDADTPVGVIWIVVGPKPPG